MDPGLTGGLFNKTVTIFPGLYDVPAHKTPREFFVGNFRKK